MIVIRLNSCSARDFYVGTQPALLELAAKQLIRQLKRKDAS